MGEDGKNDGAKPASDSLSPSPALNCALCGCSTPAVRCDRCNSQIFCLSCDDMYHRHPKRKLHLRKAVDSIWNSQRSPRLRRRTDLPGDPSKIPIPPPRSKKRERHILGGRLFLKSSHELGSFGYSKVFDTRHLPSPVKNDFDTQKPPIQSEETYENEPSFPNKNLSDLANPDEIYENDNVVNHKERSNGIDRSPWNSPRPNISSPIQVTIPSNSPDIVTNGQSFLNPQKLQSRSSADLAAPPIPIGPYHYPYPFLPQAPHSPYSHSAPHFNCGQCLSSSWTNLMSPHPSPFFHPMPWGSAAHGTMPVIPPFGPPPNGQRKHSQGDLPVFPDPNFPYHYPHNAFYPNGGMIDPNFMRDMRQQTSGTSKSRKADEHSSNSEENTHNPKLADGTDEQMNSPSSVSNNPTNAPPVEEHEETKPSVPEEPWSCEHCTFINPAGIYICQVCCKTSYKVSTAKSDAEDEIRARRNYNSSSPMELVNMDAEANSHYTDYPKPLKVT